MQIITSYSGCLPLCIALVIIAVTFAQKTETTDSSSSAPINSHYLKMGFIPDSTTSPDTSSGAEPPRLYQPENDSHFLNRSSAQPDFTPMKRAAPKVPDRPDIIDMSPYRKKTK